MAQVSKATLVLEGSTRGLRRAMSKAQRTMRSAASGIKRRARRMGQAVASAMAAAGSAMVAFAAKSTQMAARFEKNMVKVNTLVGLSRDRVQGMRDDVLSLAAKTGQAPTKLAKALFRLTSGGIRGAEALDALEKSAQAARIGMGEVNELARIATSSVQAFESQGADMNSVLNTIFGTIREGNVRVGRLQSAFGMLQTVAADAGVTMQGMGAFLATTSRTMGDTSKAARGLRQFLVRLQDPTGDMPEAFREAGTSVEEFRAAIQEKGLPRALVNLARGAKENGVEFAKMVTSTESLPAILTAARTSAEALLEIYDRMTNTQSEFQDAVDETSKTLSDQIARLKQTGRVAMIQFGERFAPAVEELVSKVRRNMPQISATIARVMADSISVIRSIMSFVDGAVKEMAIGGLVGFLFLGPQGAAIGGIIGKVIAENEARLKHIANQIPWVDFETSEIAQTKREIQDVGEGLRDLTELTRFVQNKGKEELSTGQRLRIVAEGINVAGKSEKELIDALSKKALKLHQRYNRLQLNLENMLASGMEGKDEQGLLGRLAEEAKVLEERLRRIARQGGVSGLIGGGGEMPPTLAPVSSLLPQVGRGGGGGGLPFGRRVAPTLAPVPSLKGAGEEGKKLGSVIQGTVIPAFSQLGALMGDTASQVLNAATQIASSIAKIIQSSTMSLAGPAGLVTLGAGLISGFAGFFQHGGTIPAGQFGIVGESGPEPVAGPATVFPDTGSFAAAAGGGGGGVSIDPNDFKPSTRYMLARDPAWQAAMDATLEENERQGGKVAEMQARGGRP